MLKEDNKTMLNLIDFEPYLQIHRDLRTVVWDIENDYSNMPELAATNGTLLPYLTMNEFAQYLVARYPAYEFYTDDGGHMVRPRKEN